MSQWVFSALSGAAVRRDPQETELFKTEDAGEGEYAGTDALVREVIQNSMDAGAGDGPIRVRFAIHSHAELPPADRLACYFRRLAPGLAYRDIEFDAAGVPALAEMIRSDPAIFPLIYPQIIRQVLARAIDEGADADDVEDDRWPALWVAFGRKLHPEHAEPPLPDEEEAVEEWIETLIDSFCQLHQLRGKFEGSAYLSGSGD